MVGANHVFVYGSLKSDLHNNFYLKDSELICKKALTSTPYACISLGSFPGLLKITGVSASKRTIGEVYSCDDQVLTLLDMVESNGNFYIREIVEVTLENGETLDCWCYFLNLERIFEMCPVNVDKDCYEWSPKLMTKKQRKALK